MNNEGNIEYELHLELDRIDRRWWWCYRYCYEGHTINTISMALSNATNSALTIYITFIIIIVKSKIDSVCRKFKLQTSKSNILTNYFQTI